MKNNLYTFLLEKYLEEYKTKHTQWLSLIGRFKGNFIFTTVLSKLTKMNMYHLIGSLLF